MTFKEWLEDWKYNRPHERLGQAFVNDFVKESFPELYYCQNRVKCLDIISEWLERYHYSYDTMPQKIERGEYNGYL